MGATLKRGGTRPVRRSGEAVSAPRYTAEVAAKTGTSERTVQREAKRAFVHVATARNSRLDRRARAKFLSIMMNLMQTSPVSPAPREDARSTGPMSERASQTCRWPSDDAAGRTVFVCAAPRVEKGKPYCLEHSSLARQPRGIGPQPAVQRR